MKKLRFADGAWKFRTYTNAGDVIPNSNFMVVVSPPADHRFADKEFLVCDSLNEQDARLISAAPDMYAALDAADTAFAVLQVQDLGSQARSCVREAWPLVQSALAKANPGSSYAEAVGEAQQHEIARLDGVIADLRDRLADIANVLKDCPGVGIGNTKVHYAYYVAAGGVE